MDAWRTHVLEVAQTWLLTRWHHRQCKKGAGVDCGRYIHAVFHEAGLVPAASFESYPADWMMHRSEERFLGWVEKYADRVEVPQPADIVVWRYGQCFSHGAIVFDWPRVLHSYRRERGVVWGDASKGELATELLKDGTESPREVRFYSIAGRL